MFLAIVCDKARFFRRCAFILYQAVLTLTGKWAQQQILRLCFTFYYQFPVFDAYIRAGGYILWSFVEYERL